MHILQCLLCKDVTRKTARLGMLSAKGRRGVLEKMLLNDGFHLSLL